MKDDFFDPRIAEESLRNHLGSFTGRNGKPLAPEIPGMAHEICAGAARNMVAKQHPVKGR